MNVLSTVKEKHEMGALAPLVTYVRTRLALTRKATSDNSKTPRFKEVLTAKCCFCLLNVVPRWENSKAWLIYILDSIEKL